MNPTAALQHPFVETFHHSLPTGDLTVEVQPGGWPMDTCLDIGARINPKRGFLFVSKLLGKHIPTPTALIKEAHEALLDQLAPQLKPGKPTVFIAMAETATGLGHGLFEAALERFGQDQPWVFLTSTRYDMGPHPRIDFVEEHSHAASQWMYLPRGESLAVFRAAQDVVLIDDEVSTGKTFLNLERALTPHMPQLATVSWVTLTSLAAETARPSFHLLRGGYSFSSKSIEVRPTSAVGAPVSAVGVLSKHWGRLGTQGVMQAPKGFIADLMLTLSRFEGQKPILVLGQGEFMHAAVVVAEFLESVGISCLVQSTTRSPVMVWGAIASVRSAPDPVGDGVEHFVYNLDTDRYAAILMLCEEGVSPAVSEFCASLKNAIPVSMAGWKPSR